MPDILKKILLVVVALAAIQNWDRLTGAFSRPEPVADVGTSDVVLYATTWCGYCEKTRKLLRERGVPFVEHDIERSAEARKRFEALGGRGVPLLVVKGKIIRGYSPQGILAALGQ